MPSKADREPKYIVYGLVDPRTLTVEYTGKSMSGMTRPRRHRTKSSLRANSTKNIWLRELFAAGLDYEIVVLDSVADPKAPGTLCWWWTGKNATALNDLERWHIAMGRASGWTLKNETDGGEGGSGRIASAELRTARSAWVKTYRSLPAVIAEYSTRSKLLWEDPAYRSNTVEAITLDRNRPEIRAQVGARSKDLWEDTTYRDKVIAGIIAYRSRPEVVAAARERMLGDKNPTKRPDVAAKISAANKGRRKPVDELQPCGTYAAYHRAAASRRACLPNCGPCDLCTAACRAYSKKNYRRTT